MPHAGFTVGNYTPVNVVQKLDGSSALDLFKVTHVATPVAGGIDLSYTLTNISGAYQMWPRFVLDSGWNSSGGTDPLTRVWVARYRFQPESGAPNPIWSGHYDRVVAYNMFAHCMALDNGSDETVGVGTDYPHIADFALLTWRPNAFTITPNLHDVNVNRYIAHHFAPGQSRTIRFWLRANTGAVGDAKAVDSVQPYVDHVRGLYLYKPPALPRHRLWAVNIAQHESSTDNFRQMWPLTVQTSIPTIGNAQREQTGVVTPYALAAPFDTPVIRSLYSFHQFGMVGGTIADYNNDTWFGNLASQLSPSGALLSAGGDWQIDEEVFDPNGVTAPDLMAFHLRLVTELRALYPAAKWVRWTLPYPPFPGPNYTPAERAQWLAPDVRALAAAHDYGMVTMFSPGPTWTNEQKLTYIRESIDLCRELFPGKPVYIQTGAIRSNGTIITSAELKGWLGLIQKAAPDGIVMWSHGNVGTLDAHNAVIASGWPPTLTPDQFSGWYTMLDALVAQYWTSPANFLSKGYGEMILFAVSGFDSASVDNYFPSIFRNLPDNLRGTLPQLAKWQEDRGINISVWAGHAFSAVQYGAYNSERHFPLRQGRYGARYSGSTFTHFDEETDGYQTGPRPQVTMAQMVPQGVDPAAVQEFVANLYEAMTYCAGVGFDACPEVVTDPWIANQLRAIHRQFPTKWFAQESFRPDRNQALGPVWVFGPTGLTGVQTLGFNGRCALLDRIYPGYRQIVPTYHNANDPLMISDVNFIESADMTAVVFAIPIDTPSAYPTRTLQVMNPRLGEEIGWGNAPYHVGDANRDDTLNLLLHIYGLAPVAEASSITGFTAEAGITIVQQPELPALISETAPHTLILRFDTSMPGERVALLRIHHTGSEGDWLVHFDWGVGACAPTTAPAYATTVGVREEAVWGVVDAGGVSRGLEFRTESLVNRIRHTDGRVRINMGRKQITPFAGRQDPGGSLEGELLANGAWPIILKHAIGGVVASSSLGAGVYEHEFTTTDERFTGLTIDKIIRYKSGDRRMLRYLGCKVGMFGLRIRRDVVTCRAEVLAGRELVIASPLPTFEYSPFTEPFISRRVTLLVDPDGDNEEPTSILLDAESFDLSIENALNGNDYRVQNAAYRRSIPIGIRTITGQMRVRVTPDSFAFYQRFLEHGPVALGVLLTQPLPGGASHNISITLPSVRLRGSPTPMVGGRGPLTMDFGFLGYRHPNSDNDILLSIHNGESTLTTGP